MGDIIRVIQYYTEFSRDYVWGFKGCRVELSKWKV